MASKKSLRKEYFDPVDLKTDFPEEEKKILKSWYKNGVVNKYLHKNDKSDKYYSFLDGPITANNPMGVHHAWGRTYKDLWPRYKNMKGYKQRFQNGFDCQGLWVEVEVEKELGFKNKKDIEKFGIAKFVQLCKDRVKKYSGIQTEQSKRLGYFADWDHSYYTLSDDNNYMIWNFLKKVHDNGWLYKGSDSVPWCPRCETAISQHEMLTEDYKEVTHESIYMKFPIQDRKNEYLLVWTTTPWTIPANIAVAVDMKIFYSLIEMNENRYWTATEAKERVLGNLPYKEIKKVKGEELVGLKYKGAFDDLPAVKKVSDDNKETFHKVIPTDDVLMPITVTEGTGMVHTAVSAGTEDFRLGQKLGLPMIPVINDDASYVEGFGFLTGQNAKKTPRLILDYMEENGFSFKIEKYKHRYPACWRCKSELVWKVTDEWYISMDKPSSIPDGEKKDKRTLRERMIEIAKRIEWIPSFGLDRELDWLANMHDWLISKKNRYWGLALPIWECQSCGNFEVIGGKDELKTRTVSGWEKFQGKSPHKPQIDEIKIKCSKCGKLMERIEPVGNPWLDAGIVSYSTVSENNMSSNFDVADTKPLYLINKEEWKNWIPADFITESFPGQFKNWFYSLIAMSTVMEDINPFKKVLGFGTLLDEKGDAMHKSTGNMIEFGEGADKIGVDVMRWMYIRHNPADNLLFGFNIANDVRRSFHLKIWNTYNYFVTYANLNKWSPNSDKLRIMLAEKDLTVLDQWILSRLNKTERNVSRYLDKYESYKAASELENFVDDLSNWYIRRSRDRAALNFEDEKEKDSFFSVCYYTLCNLMLILAPFNPFISEIIFKNLTKKYSVHLEDWPNFDNLDINSKLFGEMEKIREFAETSHSKRKDLGIPVRQPLQTLKIKVKKGTFTPEMLRILASEVNVKDIVEDLSIKDSINLDIKITESLKEEAKLRELIRLIQNERKTLNVQMDEKVNIAVDWKPKNKDLIKELKNATLADSIEYGEFKVSRVD